MRKIVRNLTKMNWLAAIGEIFLIFIGVVAALWFENWNDERKEHEDQAKILIELEEDFLFNKVQLQKKMSQLGDLKSATDEVLIYSGWEGKPLSITNADSLLYRVNQIHTFDPREQALQGIIYSGKLNIISSPELRKLLGEWKVTLAEAQEEVPIAQDLLNNKLRPYLNRWVSWRGIEQTMKTGLEGEHDHRQVFQELEFENLIWSYRHRVAYLIEEYMPLKEAIENLLEGLKKEIKDLKKQK